MTAAAQDQAGRRMLVGGKAADLEAARAAGLPVPAMIALTVDEVATICAEPTGDSRAARALRDRLPELGASTFAVRSSAQAEDGAHSFAGQFETKLNVGPENLLDAVRQVAASGRRKRVASYARATGADAGSVAVVVQQMVAARWSGVAFSRDPLTYQPEVIVEAVEGPGEFLVGGDRTPTRAWYDRASVARLDHTETDPVPAEVLDEAAALALRCEEVFETARDVEWVHDGTGMHVLQSRELTGFRDAEVYSDTWSAEVWPGLIKPLVFDVGDIAVNAAWGRILTSVAGPVDVDWRRMAGVAASRVYFNETLLGDVLTRAGLPENTLESVVRGERPRVRDGSIPRLAVSLGRLTRFLSAQVRWRNRLDHELPHLRTRIRQLSHEHHSSSRTALAAHLDPLLSVLQEAARLSVLTTLSMGLRHLGARATARILTPGVEAQVRSDSSPGTSPLADVARVAEGLDELCEQERAVVATGDVEQIVTVLGQGGDGAVVLEQMEALLVRWGHVAAVNTDFSTPAWRDDPGLLWRLAATTGRHASHRDRTPGTEDAAIHGPGTMRQRLVARRTAALQTYVDARDEVNDVLALAYDAWRRLARAAGQALTPDVLPSPDHIFYLRLEELRAALLGTHDADLRQVLIARAGQLERDAELVPPHRLWDLRLPERRRMTPDGQARIREVGALLGVPASPGIVEGRARVLGDPAQGSALTRGDVLVVDHADIGWTPLFTVAGAIVTGVGGALCHAAVVARELGIPAVVGLPDATTRIPDGTAVRVLGGEGAVVLLNDGHRQRSATEGES